METLPLELSNAIDRELASVQPDKLRDACAELTHRYSRGQHIETQLHRQAYIAARLPATYGAIRQVFRRSAPYLRDIHSLLDLGAGVGSLAWAAREAIPTLKRVTLFERDIELLRLGQHLSQERLSPLKLAWCRDDLSRDEPLPPHDAVIMSYVLNELNANEKTQALQYAYEAADKLFILIEPGTPEGYKNILKARKLLIDMGATVLAPCPHNGPCPLASAFPEGKDWCHFRVRIPRSKYHKQAKEGTLPYEDEKYSYLVVSPQLSPPPYDRILKMPIKKTGHVILDLCTRTGNEERRIVSKSDGKVYPLARDADWGDEWED